jgi:hypothetical protein
VIASVGTFKACVVSLQEEEGRSGGPDLFTLSGDVSSTMLGWCGASTGQGFYISLLMRAPSISLAWFLRTLGSHSFWVMKVPDGLKVL